MAIRDQAKAHPPTIRAALTEKRRRPEAALEHIDEGDDVIAGMFNSEPLTVLDALEANAERLSDVRIHQMFPFRERPYMHGAFAGLRHVSWFLSPANREAFHKDTCDLVPNNFSEVPALMRRTTRCSLVLAAVSPPDRYSYFSLGTHADYVAALIGEAPFFVEVNHRMPRTYGENQLHLRHNGLHRTNGEGSDAQMPTSSRMSVDVRRDHNLAFLTVVEPGADLRELIRVRLRELCLHRVDCIYVDLPLSHPAVQSAGARLDELGFFFGGIVPELRDGDVLRLQYLNEVDIRPDDVRTGSDFGRELADLIFQEMSTAER